MKKFYSKVIVKMKPTVKDVKCQTLKQAVESYMPIKNLCCEVGNVYFLQFEANSEGEALHAVEKMAQDILSNDVIETYEIRALEEIY